MELVPYLLSIDGAKFFLPDKRNQDPLEKPVAHIIMRGVSPENPVHEMFGLMNRKIGVIKSDLLQVFRGNTRGRMRDEINTNIYDTCELPKRPRKS